MKRIAMLVIGLGLLCLPSVHIHGATHMLADCDSATVQARHDNRSTVAGDVLVLPACNGTGLASWDDTDTVTITKDITIRGSGCTYDANDRPTACSTIITDSRRDSNPLFKFELTANVTPRLSQIQINDGGTRNGYANYTILIMGAADPNRPGPEDSRRFILDHMFFNRVHGWTPWVRSAWGVMANNTLNIDPRAGAHLPIYCAGPADFDYADARWAEPTSFGTDKAVYIENNTINRPAAAGTFYAATDGYGGCKFVVRYNDIINSWIELHGTESGGRARGGRMIEVYGNRFTCSLSPATLCHTMVNMRSGPTIIWGNTVSGFSPAPAAARLDNQRQDEMYVGGMADGTSLMDVNDSRAYGTFTASVANGLPALGTQTVTVAGQSWKTNEWAGYTIRKVGCASVNRFRTPCAALVLSNTATVLHYAFDHDGLPEPQGNPRLFFAANDQFTLNKVTEVWDGACRSGGTLLSARMIRSITRNGTRARVTTVGNHGLRENDDVMISDSGFTEPGVQYQGTFADIHVIDGDEFEYTTYTTPSGPVNMAFVTKIPTGWNDQVTDHCYQFMNTGSGTNLMFSHHHWPISIRPNEHYFNYVGGQQTTPTAPFNGASGVGAGTVTNRPTSCSKGVGYWATDEGGNWNSSSAGMNDGRLHKCTAPNTWTPFYTPYAFPHPLLRD